MSETEEPYRTPAYSPESKAGNLPRGTEPGDVPKLEYIKCFTFLREHSRWKENLLMGTMMNIIIGFGQMAFLGHLFEMIRGLREGSSENSSGETGDEYPPFKIERFNELMSAGVAPFFVYALNMVMGYVLMAIIAMILIIPLAVVVFTAMFGILVLLGIDQPKPFVDVLAGIMAGLGMYLGAVIASMPARVFFLRAGITRKFGAAYDFGFTFRFIRLTWKEQFKAGLFMMLSVPLLIVVSMLLCVVPLYPTLAWVWYAMAYMDYQIYEIYLAKGGELIESAA